MKRGAAAQAGYEAEHAKQEAKAAARASGAGNAWRFRLGQGERAGIIILDQTLDDMTAFYEHVIPGPDGKFGKGSHNESCPKEFEICPLCERFKESYYVSMLSCLDTRGFDRKDERGAIIEHVNQSRRLLAIKTQSLPAYMQVLQFAQQQYGTIRGLYMEVARAKDNNAPSIGAPQMLEDTGTLFRMYSDADLRAWYSHPPILGRDGKTQIKAADEDITPYDYPTIFPPPSAEDIRKRFNMPAIVGNARSVVDQWEQAENDGIPMDHDHTGAPVHNPPPGVRSRPMMAPPIAPGGLPRALPALPAYANPPMTPAQAPQAPPRPAMAPPAVHTAPRAMAPAAAPLAARPAAPMRPGAAAPMAARPAAPARPGFAGAQPTRPIATAPGAPLAARTRPRPGAPAVAPDGDAFGGEADEPTA